MSVSQAGVIDFLGDEPERSVSYLAITDHLKWDESEPDHLVALQNKLNTYIVFIESGQVYEGRPHLHDRQLQIRVFGLYPLSDDAQEFYAQAAAVLRGLGVDLTFELREDLGRPGWELENASH